jgi:hypothetical protein
MFPLSRRFTYRCRYARVAGLALMTIFIFGLGLVTTHSKLKSTIVNQPIGRSYASDRRVSNSPARANAFAAGTSIQPLVCTVDPIVTSNADNGAGTLRQAIIDACDNSNTPLT